MTRKPNIDPDQGDARSRLLAAARDIIRMQGFAATSIDQLCKAAGVTKGAFFHHFANKEALGIAAAQYWAETSGQFFADAPYHRLADPLDRVLGYIDFRRQIIAGNLEEFTCLVGTMTQEVYHAHPAIRDACAQTLFGHAATLEPDIEQAIRAYGIRADFTSASLAAHLQAVLQGAFVLAKAADDPGVAIDSITHLRRYVSLLFQNPIEKRGQDD